MDHSESKKFNLKNWRNHRQPDKNTIDSGSNKNHIVYEESTTAITMQESPETAIPSAKNRHSIRKSLRKIHARVKNCVFHQKSKQAVASSPSTSTPPIEPPPPPPPREPPAPPTRHVASEIINLAKTCTWYCGPMSTAEAEEKLRLKPDGTFLVRDSSSTIYLFTLSFRSIGKTMHARIEYDNDKGKYNLYGNGSVTTSFPTIVELIEDAMKTSESGGVYCYSKFRMQDMCNFPVRLTNPISRYTEVRSLKCLCKFVIRQCTNVNDIPSLPLPQTLHGYLQEGSSFCTS